MKHLSKIFFFLILLCVALIFYFIYQDYKKKNPGFSITSFISSTIHNYKKDNRIRIVIDAGHGGKDVGAIGYLEKNKPIYEKDLTRLMADEMLNLADTTKYLIVETRLGDDNTHRHDRMVLARSFKPDLLISLHCNSNINKTWNGIEMHICDSTISLSDTTSRYNPNYVINKGLADTVLQNISNAFPLLKKNKVVTRRDRIWMIYAGNFPSVLVEWAYLSNKKDLTIITQPQATQALAKAIWQGINNHFNIN
jgi:N-acetylmuramoyl-L-alanine amidase